MKKSTALLAISVLVLSNYVSYTKGYLKAICDGVDEFKKAFQNNEES